MTYHEWIRECYAVGERFTIRQAIADITARHPNATPLIPNVYRALKQCERYGIVREAGKTDEHHRRVIWERML